MAIVVPDVAEITMLKYILNVIAQDGGTAPTGGQRLFRLFSNNLFPDEDTTLGDITEVSGSTGYTPVTLNGAGWTISVTSNVCTATYSEQPFLFTTKATIYGYYVTTTEGTPKLLWLERLTSGVPYVLPDDGGEVAFTPEISLD
jgi:hypothetical protein